MAALRRLANIRAGAPMRYCLFGVVTLYPWAMTTVALPTWRLDRFAIGLSGLWLVHCLATSFILAMVATAGGVLGAEWIHEVGLVLAMLMGALALGRGIFEHGYLLPS